LVAEPPVLMRDGGFVAAGHDEELDETRRPRDEGRGVIAGMQADYAKDTGISSLKIKHNNVLGYVIETTATHAEKMLAAPLNEVFIHRRTPANALRFTTRALSGRETRILPARDRALEIDRAIFARLCDTVLDQAGPIGLAAEALAEA